MAIAPAPRQLGRAAAMLLVGVFTLLICSPLVVHLSHTSAKAPAMENRALAAAPTRPHTVAELLSYPARLSDYIGDHWGLRNELVRMDGRLRYALFGEFVSDQVLMGRHGRLFFISHSAGHPFSLTDPVCGIGITQDKIAQVAAGIARLLDMSRAISPLTYVFSIPSSPIIDHGDLPRWLARRCDAADTVIERLVRALARQRPDLAGRLVYPKATLAAAGPVYPLWNFHWTGTGARPVVENFAEQVLHLPQRVRLRETLERDQHDLAPFTIGIDHFDRVPLPDYGDAGIAFCYGGGGACGADFARFGRFINEITRSHWVAGHGPSLLIISDSFGRMAARYFGEYFADVLHLNLAYDRVRPGDLESLAAQIFASGKPDVLVLLGYDGATIDAKDLAGPLGEIAAAARGAPRPDFNSDRSDR